MDFPAFQKNATVETQEVDITPPAFDDNADHSKTPEEVFIEQQWRDADASGLGKTHPLSLNRDAAEIGNAGDPYTT